MGEDRGGGVLFPEILVVTKYAGFIVQSLIIGVPLCLKYSDLRLLIFENNDYSEINIYSPAHARISFYFGSF